MSWLELSNLPLLEAIGVLGGGGAFGADTVANLAHWVKADDLTTLFQDSAKTTPVASDGDPVGAWVDQIAAEYVQATTATKPTYRASVAAYNNQPALQFDGGDWLRGAFAAALTQPTTIFLVADLSNTANRFLLDGDDAANRNALAIVLGNWRLVAGSNLDLGVADTNVNIFCAKFNGASSQLWANGVTKGVGDPGAQVLDGLTIGADTAGNNRHLGHQAELLIYNANVTTPDLNIVQNYLAVKYNISVTEFS